MVDYKPPHNTCTFDWKANDTKSSPQIWSGHSFQKNSRGVACLKGLKFKGLKFKVDPKAQLISNDMLIAFNVTPKTQLRRSAMFIENPPPSTTQNLDWKANDQ